MNEDLIERLKRCYLFNDLSDQELLPLLESALPRRYKAGEYLFRYEDVADNAYMVVSGEVTIYRWTPEGEEKKFHTFSKGNLVAEAAMFMSHGRYPMNARAERSTEVLAISRASLQAICMQKPEVAIKLIESMGQRLFSLVNRVDQLSSSSAGRRLASWMADRCKNKVEPVLINFNRQDLAVQLGTAPETLSRLINKYRAAGLISGQRGQFEVNNLSGILEMEQLSCGYDKH